MPRVSEVFGKGYYRATDIPHPMVVTIEGYATEHDRFNRGEEIHVLSLRDQQRTLRLTTTNAGDIARLYGDEISNWSGHQVELYVEQMKITDRKTGEDKVVDTIRARAPNAGNGATLPATRNDLDDEIPF